MLRNANQWLGRKPAALTSQQGKLGTMVVSLPPRALVLTACGSSRWLNYAFHSSIPIVHMKMKFCSGHTDSRT